MEGIDSRLVQNAPMAFEEAEEYFGGKIPVEAEVFYRLADQYRDLAFTVSGYTSAQIVSKFYEELLAAIENGTAMEQFRQEMSGFLERQGYEGLTPFQADNIFRTNVQSAYQAGHYAQMTDPDVLRLRPYWQYDAVNDSHTRPSHLAMDGRVFPADSPVWDTWFPPNGFRCRCTVRTLSARQVRQMGLTVETEAPVMAETGGRVVQVLPDPNFRHNPAKRPFKPDMSRYPEPLKRAYRAQRAKMDGKPG